MKRFIALSGLLALLALPAFAGDGKAMGCCGKQAGIARSVANIDNGVRVTMTATDAKMVAMLQEKSATADSEGCADCPLHAKGVTRTVDRTANGIVITATATDAALVATLQKHAASMASMSCGAKADGKAGCCAKGKAGATGCAHAEKAAPATT
jgi:hypothetical protein